uniref:Uncharacterized protein n=1 Tax=Lutzomyia longipalpis TaxID=7200 RepID=A0A1B0CP76_LUTLO
MSLEIRGAILTGFSRIQTFVDGLTDIDKQLADYSANLASQLDTVGALRKQYIDVQAEIIASKTLELHQTAEVASLKDFIQRCDLLMVKIKDRLADAPGYSATDVKPPSITSGDLTQQFLTFIQQSESRYHTSEMQHHENMEKLVNALKYFPLGATSGSALPVTAVKLHQLHLPIFDGTYGSWHSSQASANPSPGKAQISRECINKLHAGQPQQQALVNTVSTHLCRYCRKSHHPYHKCQGWHNVLLHDKSSSVDQGISSQASASSDNASDVQGSTSPPDSSANAAVCSASEIYHSYPPPRVILATALVNLLTATGQMRSCRILLDCGAQVNVIASYMANQSNLPRHPACFFVSGLRATTSRARFFVNATVVSQTNGIRITLKCFVMPQIPGLLPNWPVDSSKMHIPQHIPLADPDWAVQRPVDIIISGKQFWDCLLNDSILLGPGLPLLKASMFGHVVVGEDEVMSTCDCIVCTATTPETSLHQVRELENVPVQASQLEEQLASQYPLASFASAHQCIGDGRFLNQLHFHNTSCILDEFSRFILQEICALERPFYKNCALQIASRKACNNSLPMAPDTLRTSLPVDDNIPPVESIQLQIIHALEEGLFLDSKSDPAIDVEESESSPSASLIHQPSILKNTVHSCSSLESTDTNDASESGHFFRVITQGSFKLHHSHPVGSSRNCRDQCSAGEHSKPQLETAELSANPQCYI